MSTPILLLVWLLFPSALSSQEDAATRALAYRSYLAHVAAAEASLRLGEPAGLRRWLEAAPHAQRGFEWRRLQALSDESLRSLPLEEGVSSLSVAPDGRRIAVGGEAGALRVRAWPGGEELLRLAGHPETVFTVRFDPAGERLLTTSYDRTAAIWDARTGERLVPFERHEFPVGGGAWHPEGTLVATSSYERPPASVVGVVFLWDPASGELLRTLRAGRKPLVHLAFSPDGRWLAAASWDFCVNVWDLAGDDEARVLAVPDEGLYNAVDEVAFSPDGTRVIGVSKDGTARVWDVASGALVHTLRGHTNDVACVALAPDGSTIATGGVDETIRLWSARDGSARGVLLGHAGSVRALAFLPDGSELVSGSADATLRAWEPRTDWYGGVVLPTSDHAYACPFSPDGSRLASAGFDGRARMWDAATLDELASWQAHPEGESCHMLAWSPDGERLYSGSYDGTVAIWDALTLEELGRLVHEDGLYDFALSSDGRLLATNQGGDVWVWDTRTHERLRTLAGSGGAVNELRFQPGSTTLGITGRDGTLRLVDAASGQELATIEGASLVAFADPGKGGGSEAVLATSSGSRLSLRDAAGRELHAGVLGNNGLRRLAWSPSNERLAACGARLFVVDPLGGEPLSSWSPRGDGTYGLAWSPDGTRLAVTAGLSVELADAVPLRERLAQRRAALALRSAALQRVDEHLARGGTLAELAARVRTDPGPPDELLALRAAITLRAGAAPPAVR